MIPPRRNAFNIKESIKKDLLQQGPSSFVVDVVGNKCGIAAEGNSWREMLRTAPIHACNFVEISARPTVT